MNAINQIIAGLAQAQVGVSAATALVQLVQALRAPTAAPTGLTDLEIAQRYVTASSAAHQAVLNDEQRLDRETQAATIAADQQTT